MSDETKTKLEGDDEITLEMHNVQRRCIGVTEVPPANWNDEEEPNARRCEYAVLAWVRANLVAPAVAEEHTTMLLNLNTAWKMNVENRDRYLAASEERDGLRIKLDAAERLAKEANSLAVAYQTETRELRAQVAEAKREHQSEMLRHDGEHIAERAKIRKERDELRAKVAELEATLDTPAPAALPKVGEPVEVRDAKDWARKVVDVVGVHPSPWFQIAGLDGRKFFADAEGDTWRRVQPQPKPSEPPPEDVATPELDKALNIWVAMEPVHVRAAYRRDLSAGIARETERLREENEELRSEASGTLEALKLADEDMAKIFAVVEPVAKKGERWVAAAVRLIKERDDLRRQLREHAGECAACGAPLNGDRTYSLQGMMKEFLCKSCAAKDWDTLRAAIDARRAGM